MKLFIYSIVVLGAFGFMYGTFKAIQLSYVQRPSDMPNFLSQIVTIIGGLLATNLGAYLGIEIAQNGSFSIDSIIPEPGGEIFKKLQFWASVLYFFTLIIVTILWGALLNFREENVVSIVPQLSKTLLGVVAGFMALILGAT